jgi:putative transposase
MLVTQAYRFELDPNNHQRSALASHAGAARFAYNWGLATVVAGVAAHKALTVLAIRQGADIGEAGAWAKELAGPAPWSLPALRKEWNKAKAEVAPWWAECSKEAYSSGLDALARALTGFFRSRSADLMGKPVGFPMFKKKSSRRSYRVTTGGFGIKDRHHVRLPRIGVLRTNEPTVKLARKLSDGTARILSATVCEGPAGGTSASAARSSASRLCRPTQVRW